MTDAIFLAVSGLLVLVVMEQRGIKTDEVTAAAMGLFAAMIWLIGR